jgi:hypothetical protein
LRASALTPSGSPQHWQAYRGKTSAENQRKSGEFKPAGSRWRAFSTGGFFALPAGWCFDWVVQKAECSIDLDQLALDLLTLFLTETLS